VVTNDYQLHPLASFFPAMAEDGFEYDALRENVRLRGPDPVVLYEGQVLANFDMLHICRDLGIEPEFVHYTDDNPLVFVFRQNLNRRLWTSAFLANFVEENTSWPTRGGDRKYKKARRGGPDASLALGLLQQFVRSGTNLSRLVPFSF
jgi:hypothetical protein